MLVPALCGAKVITDLCDILAHVAVIVSQRNMDRKSQNDINVLLTRGVHGGTESDLHFSFFKVPLNHLSFTLTL